MDMKSIIRSGFRAAHPTELVNISVNADGFLSTITPTQNAVIIQLRESVGYEGERVIQRSVFIECKDEEMLPDLKEAASKATHI